MKCLITLVFGALALFAIEAGLMENIKRYCDRFAANGVLTTWEPGRHGSGNNLFLFYTDPDGNWIEISGELETIYDRETID